MKRKWKFGKQPSGKPKGRWENNKKIYLKEIGYEGGWEVN